MADVTKTPERVVASGLEQTKHAVATADNYIIRNNGRVFLHVVNGGGSPDTVTVVTPKTVADLAVSDLTVSVPAGEERFIGPFPPSVYNDGNGDIDVSHSFATSVTMAVLHL